jgi:hypothetical protein
MATTSSAPHSEPEAIFTIDHVDPVETIDAADVIVSAPVPASSPEDALAPDSGVDTFVTVWRTDPAIEPDPQTDRRDDMAVAYATAPGMPARGVVVLSLVVSAVCAAADCGLSGTLTMFFDLCFITVCLVGAMAVRREDLFTAGVLAPLVFAVVVLAVTVGVGDAFVASGSMSKAFFTGLAAHAAALVCGYGVALGVVGGRVASRRPARF